MKFIKIITCTSHFIYSIEKLEEIHACFHNINKEEMFFEIKLSGKYHACGIHKKTYETFLNFLENEEILFELKTVCICGCRSD